MPGKTWADAWLGVLVVSMAANAAELSGKITLKGDAKEGQVFIDCFGVTK